MILTIFDIPVPSTLSLTTFPDSNTTTIINKVVPLRRETDCGSNFS